jgi:hypothetical protein
MINHKLWDRFSTVCTVAIASSTALAGLSLSSTQAIAQSPSPTPIPTISPGAAPTSNSSVQEALIGEWQLKDILPLGMKVIFTADNKAYLFVPSSFPFFDGFTPGPIALDFRYRLNTNTQPLQIDILSPSGGDPVLTIFELTDNKEMRVEWVGLKQGDPRPTSFTVGSIILEKLSKTTALPRNTQFIDLQAEKLKQSQTQVRYSMQNINRSQISFYTNKKKFATNLTELGAYLSPDNNYTYETKLNPNQKPGSIATATAKASNLKSYSAAVVAFKTKGKTTTYSGICETQAASKTPPAPPTIGKTGKVTCPSGSVEFK